MAYEIINEIETHMEKDLDKDQMDKLHTTLVQCVAGSIIDSSVEIPESDLLESFISSKKVEGCSERTLKYYRYILDTVFKKLDKPLRSITTADIRGYLSQYQVDHQVSKSTIDNIRRVLSSFFSWLEEEDIIFKSPVKRIKKVKVTKHLKEVYSDESLEVLRDHCTTLRDLALVDIFCSTGMRVGELVRLDIADIDFDNRECVVLGKGDKERLVYFDARTKVHLSNYLKSRTDFNPALFVSLNEPHKRLEISGVESMFRNLGSGLDIGKVHPHKFRRTLATKAIDKGMPVEQVQRLLGHTKIDTTMEYAIVNQNNVKTSHRKYIS